MMYLRSRSRASTHLLVLGPPGEPSCVPRPSPTSRSGPTCNPLASDALPHDLLYILGLPLRTAQRYVISSMKSKTQMSINSQKLPHRSNGHGPNDAGNTNTDIHTDLQTYKQTYTITKSPEDPLLHIQCTDIFGRLVGEHHSKCSIHLRERNFATCHSAGVDTFDQGGNFDMNELATALSTNVSKRQ